MPGTAAVLLVLMEICPVAAVRADIHNDPHRHRATQLASRR
jgi:hypothetical protein